MKEMNPAQTDMDLLYEYGPPSEWPEDMEPELRERLLALWDSLSMRERKDILKAEKKMTPKTQTDEDVLAWADKMLEEKE